MLLRQVYRALKDNAALLSLIEEDLLREPDNAYLWVEAGQLYLSQGNGEQAEKSFDTALKIAPDDQGLVLSIYYAYKNWGYIDEGIAFLLEARKRGTEPGAYAMEIASMYEIRGDWKNAANEYALYLEQYPDRFGDVERRMNEVAADSEQLEELESAVEKLRDTGVQGDRIDRMLARLQARQGEYERAVQSLIDAETKRGSKGVYVLGFMREAQQAGAHNAVIKAGDYLFDAEPRIAQEAALITASSVRAQGKPDKAKTILMGLLESKSPSIAVGAMTLLGQIELYDLGNIDSAEEYFDRAITRYPRTPGVGLAYRGLTDVYIRQNNLAAAERVLQQRRKTAPQDQWALFGLGELAFFRGSVDTAGGIFQAVVLGFPTSFEANNAVEYLALIADAAESEKMPRIAGVFMLMRQRKNREAIEELNSLIEELEGEIWLDLLLWTRATLHLELENLTGATNDLVNIIENYPDGYHAAQSLELLGDLAAKSGDITSAADYYNRVLTDYPEAVNIERVRGKLREIPGNL